MSSYLYAAAMLTATIAGFLLLARLLQALRAGDVRLPGKITLTGKGAPQQRIVIEQVRAIDTKRRLLLVRCDSSRVLLLTGGPVDLVVCALPARPADGAPS